MKKLLILSALLFSCYVTEAKAQKNSGVKTEKSDWTELQKHKIPEWFKDAKFGLYAHLGVYCVPAYGNEWYPKRMYAPDKETGEISSTTIYHEKTYGKLTEFGYKDFIPMFKAEKFDAAEWAQLFKDAGAKFAGIVTEHHDGFAMWDSKINPWNAANMGPKRNIYGDIAKEIRKRDMKLLATFHHGINYTTYFDSDIESDLNDPAAKYLYGRIPKEEGDRRWFEQIKEVIDIYKPDQIWFDFDLGHVADSMKHKFASYYYSKEKEWNTDLIITRKNKQLPEGVGVLDIERGGREKIYEDLWQTDDAVAVNSWCWTNGLKLKPTSELVHELIDIVSKNGVLLLNACPKADGTIPADQQKILREIGHFLNVNGEAIYASRPFRVLGEGAKMDYAGRGRLNDSAGGEKGIKYSSDDIRYTRSKDGKTIYAFALGWPTNGMTLKSLSEEVKGNKIKSINLLGSKSKVKWSTAGSTLKIETASSTKPKNQYAYVWKIAIK